MSFEFWVLGFEFWVSMELETRNSKLKTQNAKLQTPSLDAVSEWELYTKILANQIDD
jgi:hypothetical protein